MNNLEKPKEKSDGGGDYWISCTSALTNACKNNNGNLVSEKINFLNGQIKSAPYKRTKDMYQRNIDILSSYRDYDFAKLKPKKVTEFETIRNTKAILPIKGVSINVFPSHVFTYNNDGIQEIGAIWFNAQLGGFKIDELEIFSELLYKYIVFAHKKKYVVNPDFCIAIDVATKKELKYSQVINNGTESILDATIAELRKFLRK